MKLNIIEQGHYLCKDCGAVIIEGDDHTARDCRRSSVERFIKSQIKRKVTKFMAIVVLINLTIFAWTLLWIQRNFITTLVEVNASIVQYQNASDKAITGMSQAIDLLYRGK